MMRIKSMKRIFTGTIIGLSIMLVGCAKPTIWDKPGATQDDFNKDAYACEKDARQSGYFGTGIVGAMNLKTCYDQCMVSKGYRPRIQD